MGCMYSGGGPWATNPADARNELFEIIKEFDPNATMHIVRECSFVKYIYNNQIYVAEIGTKTTYFGTYAYLMDFDDLGDEC